MGNNQFNWPARKVEEFGFAPADICFIATRQEKWKNGANSRATISPGDPTALLEDSEGAVWIGAAFGGLFRYDGSAFENISTSRPEIQCLLEDREKSIWAGTLGGGLNRIRRRVVQLQGMDSGRPFESIRSLSEDARRDPLGDDGKWDVGATFRCRFGRLLHRRQPGRAIT